MKLLTKKSYTAIAIILFMFIVFTIDRVSKLILHSSPFSSGIYFSVILLSYIIGTFFIIIVFIDSREKKLLGIISLAFWLYYTIGWNMLYVIYVSARVFFSSLLWR